MLPSKHTNTHILYTTIYYNTIHSLSKTADYDIIMSMKVRKGINVRKWCMAHEAYIEEKLAKELAEDELADMIALHEKHMSWLMHERLIHLIVLFITVILVLFSMALILFSQSMFCASVPMFVITFVLAAFYVRHYFFLENTVQHWYELDELMESKLKESQHE